jgi:hypothetical protein
MFTRPRRDRFIDRFIKQFAGRCAGSLCSRLS